MNSKKQNQVIQKEKDVQISRIQSIDYSENLVHRIFNVTKLEIKTPGKMEWVKLPYKSGIVMGKKIIIKNIKKIPLVENVFGLYINANFV